MEQSHLNANCWSGTRVAERTARCVRENVSKTNDEEEERTCC